MQVHVLYADRNEITYDIENYDHVADVDAPEHYSVERALEYAFRRCQNLDGSWSMGESIVHEGHVYDNSDYDINVMVLKPLRKDYRGKHIGHRSASVGDRMIVDGDIYEVDSFGFKKVA